MKHSSLFMVLLLSGLFLFPAAGVLGDLPTREDVLSGILYYGLGNWHYQPVPVDDSFSKKAFKAYLERLDYGKNFLFRSDIEALQKYSLLVDDGWRSGRFSLAEDGDKILKNRVRQAQAYCKELFKKPLEFRKEEALELDPRKRGYFLDAAALQEYWRKRVKYMALTYYLDLIGEEKGATSNLFDPVKEEKARKAVEKGVNSFFNRLLEASKDDVNSHFLNAVTAVFDPHTSYFAPDKKDEFEIEMSGTLEGIGALLGEENGYIRVAEVIPGGPVWREGKIKAGDLILKVAQGDEDPVDLVGINVTEAVKYIRGKKGSRVRLTVRKPDGRIEMVALVRDVVQIQETYARSSLIKEKSTGKTYGYIELPKFYHDIKNQNNGRSSSGDVAKEVEKLRRLGVAGIVLDLRNNGGGLLDDAVKMTGLFFPSGPVVQVKDKKKPAQILRDDDGRVTWSGPLIVLVNAMSASASEIVAGALQDYGRAIIVGGETTFGKGTVQAMLNLDDYTSDEWKNLRPLGALTLTIQKFYRVTGASTQVKGVVPDVVLPDPMDALEIGERYMDYPLTWDHLSALSFQKWNQPLPIREVQRRSRERVLKDPLLGLFQKNRDRLIRLRGKTLQNLNLQTFQKEQIDLRREDAQIRRLQKENPLLEPLPTESDGELKGEPDYQRKRRGDWFQEIRKDPFIVEALSVFHDMDVVKPPVKGKR